MEFYVIISTEDQRTNSSRKDKVEHDEILQEPYHKKPQASPTRTASS